MRTGALLPRVGWILIVVLAGCRGTGEAPAPMAEAATQPATLSPTASPTPLPVARRLPPLRPAMAPSPFPTCEPDPVAPFRYDAAQTAPVARVQSAQPSLRERAQARGLWLGASTGNTGLKNPQYSGLMVNEFNMLAVEAAMKWDVLRPTPEQYDFSAGDAIVAFGRANEMQIYAHALVWDLQQPDWLTQGQFSRAQGIDILCRHIKTVVGHYRGQIYAWDVVNEMLQNNGELRDTVWLRTIGPEYIAMAFQWAREADPQALLIFNEHFAEGMNEKSDAVYHIVEGLLRMGVPVDGVGLQMHLWLYGPPSTTDMQRNMARLAALDLRVHITEMDVRLQYIREPQAKKLAEQAQIYRQAMRACLDTPTCEVFVTWGLSDRHSWIPDWTGYPDAPLLFDEDYLPKGSYWAIMEELAR